jgi:hypothetical protein
VPAGAFVLEIGVDGTLLWWRDLGNALGPIELGVGASGIFITARTNIDIEAAPGIVIPGSGGNDGAGTAFVIQLDTSGNVVRASWAQGAVPIAIAAGATNAAVALQLSAPLQLSGVTLTPPLGSIVVALVDALPGASASAFNAPP